MTIHLRADQVVSGLALTFLGTGLARVLGEGLSAAGATSQLPRLTVPVLSEIPFIGPVFLTNQSVLVYVGYALVPLTWFWIEKTRPGLHLRAVGQNPGAADAQGIDVYRLRYAYVLLGGLLAGLAGATITLAIQPGWFSDQTVAGRGWIAIGLVIFAQWSPIRAAFGAFLFGAISRFILDIQGVDTILGLHEPVPGRPLGDVLPRDAAVPARDRRRGDSARARRSASALARRPRSASRTSAENAASETASAIRPRGRRGRAAPSGRSRWCRTRAGAGRTAMSPPFPGRPARTRRPRARRPGRACRPAAGRAASRTRGARTRSMFRVMARGVK